MIQILNLNCPTSNLTSIHIHRTHSLRYYVHSSICILETLEGGGRRLHGHPRGAAVTFSHCSVNGATSDFESLSAIAFDAGMSLETCLYCYNMVLSMAPRSTLCALPSLAEAVFLDRWQGRIFRLPLLSLSSLVSTSNFADKGDKPMSEGEDNKLEEVAKRRVSVLHCNAKIFWRKMAL